MPESKKEPKIFIDKEGNAWDNRGNAGFKSTVKSELGYMPEYMPSGDEINEWIDFYIRRAKSNKRLDLVGRIALYLALTIGAITIYLIW